MMIRCPPMSHTFGILLRGVENTGWLENILVSKVRLDDIDGRPLSPPDKTSAFF